MQERREQPQGGRHKVPAEFPASIEEGTRFLDSLIENIPDMIFVKDARDLRFILFNRAGEQLLGYAREDLIGRNDYDFFTKEEADFFTAKDREVLRSGRMHELFEEPIHTAHQGRRLLHTKKIPVVDEKGNPQYLLGISEDVTELRTLEREVLDISDRERRRIGQDLHDGLGQQLVGIAFLIKALEARLRSTDHPATTEAARIVELINQAVLQTRDVARLLSPIDIEANGLGAALENLAHGAQGIANIECHCRVDDSARIQDSTLASQLYRIAQECLTNAIKHSRASTVTIALRCDQTAVTLEVVDDGIGMEVPVRPTDPGMGLSIMRYRARMIGGILSIRSQPGAGTVVSCIVPRDPR
ncbi:MAG: PAS domain-containing protein [Candidatus Eisenbacteria bacterium]|uniref:Oxygen sensor histidine kinase NreB n=1 Tax=Eiseniibacteriota bacterium TaxID=2212470 RepID=A0A956LYD2_UNCEI|nr:PAS domain-containing protein [Candidatus Eisenbacteria bacterium]